MKFILSLLLLIQFSHAQISTSPTFPSEGSEIVPEIVKPKDSSAQKVVSEAQPVKTDPVSEEVAKATRELSNSKQVRDQSFGSVMLGYQFLTSWLPSKKTISYTHIFNDKWSLEAEYSWATIDFPIVGVDLGAIKEKRYTLQARRYVGNSFHFSFGPILNEFNARLGSDFLDNLGNEIKSSFKVQNLGVTGGMGNRWQWSNGVTFGIDWLRINIPLIETKIKDNVLDAIINEDDQDDIKKVIRTFNRIPTFVLFGLNLGYSF